MSMTATDFRALAGVIADARAMAREYQDDAQHSEYSDGVLDATDVIAHNMARHCATRNHLFDRARFMAACGIEYASDGTTDVSAVV